MVTDTTAVAKGAVIFLVNDLTNDKYVNHLFLSGSAMGYKEAILELVGMGGKVKLNGKLKFDKEVRNVDAVAALVALGFTIQSMENTTNGNMRLLCIKYN